MGIPEEELLRQQQELFAKVGSVSKVKQCSDDVFEARESALLQERLQLEQVDVDNSGGGEGQEQDTGSEEESES